MNYFLFYIMFLISAFFLHMETYWAMIYNFGDSRKNGYKAGCISSLKNQIFVTLPSLICLETFVPNAFTSNNFVRSFFLVPFYIVMTDIWFYGMHRLAHTKRFWKYHKKHHKFRMHIAASLDSDMLEHFWVNQMSVLIGMILEYFWIGPINIYVFYIWVVFVTYQNNLSHMENSILHANHHKYLKCNYGNGFYIMDRLMGSYRPR